MNKFVEAKKGSISKIRVIILLSGSLGDLIKQNIIWVNQLLNTRNYFRKIRRENKDKKKRSDVK